MRGLAMTEPVVGALRVPATRRRPRGFGGVWPDDLHGLLAAATSRLTPAQLTDLPVVLCAADVGAAQVRAFVSACRDDARRLRPSASLDLEAARLLAPFAAIAGWRGSGHVVMSPTGAFGHAVRTAAAMLARGAQAVALCEVRAGDEAEYPAATCLFTSAPDGSGRAPAGYRGLADASAAADLVSLWRLGHRDSDR